MTPSGGIRCREVDAGYRHVYRNHQKASDRPQEAERQVDWSGWYFVDHLALDEFLLALEVAAFDQHG